MSPIQMICAVAVPLIWGYQFVVIKVGVTEFPPFFFLALRFLITAFLLIPFVKRPARDELAPIAAISLFLGGLNFDRADHAVQFHGFPVPCIACDNALE